MKRTIALIIIAAIAISAIAFAESKTFTLLDNATVGAGSVIQIPYKVYKLWTCEAAISGHPDNATIVLEGNISGGSSFVSMTYPQDTLTIPSSNLTAGIYLFTISDTQAKAIRGRVVSMSGGVNPRISMTCLGSE
ncbi:MAG: hypothetical protein HQK97_12925 [Nitrospirae bacterium]|nr:hypothetical protein [Nitrospirota bacterium]